MHKRFFRLNRLAQTAILAGILVAANVVAQRWFTRWDLTQRREYTLSLSTKKLLAGLDDQVVVNAYFSRRLPPYLTHLRRQVQDLLEEYRAFAHGRLELEFTDPGSDPGAEQRMRSLGIPRLQLEVLERDQFQLSNVYLGLALLHGGRQEVIPVVQDTGNLEYELTAALLRLTSPKKKTVGWLGGPAADPRARAVDPLRRELARLYELREVPVTGLTVVPEGVETLVVAGPRALPEAARFALDQFVMRGGRTIFLVDHIEIPEGTLSAIPMESGVHDLLERYGVKVARDVVGEPRLNSPAAFSSGFLQFRIAYPWWLRVPAAALDRAHPVTASLEGLVLPWTSSLEPVVPAADGLQVSVLAKSSPEAFADSANFDFAPQPQRGPATARAPAGGRVLAVLLSGQFPSFWSDKTPPAAPAAGAVTLATPPETKTRSSETSILVLGTSRIAEPEFLRQFPENVAFLLNAIDWMTIGPELIGIRSRNSQERLLEPATEAFKTAVKLLNVIGVPLLIAFIGILRLNARRRRGTAA